MTTDNKNPLLCAGNQGHLIGKNPLETDVFLLEQAGHTHKPLAKVIREKCLDCCVFEPGEVRKCVATSCPLWPYRMGKNVFTADKLQSSRAPEEK